MLGGVVNKLPFQQLCSRYGFLIDGKPVEQPTDDEVACFIANVITLFQNENQSKTTTTTTRTTTATWWWMSFQRVVASVSICFMIPVLAVVWTSVYLVDKTSPIFTQKRMGYGGREFTVFKFRTMKENTCCVTRLGAILRKLHLDELPQLFNIAVGDMMFVGPRPLMASELLMSHRLGWASESDIAKRCSVRPGLTGKAQLTITEATLNLKLQTDNEYVSLSAQERVKVDVKYLFETLRRVALKLVGRRHSTANR